MAALAFTQIPFWTEALKDAVCPGEVVVVMMPIVLVAGEPVQLAAGRSKTPMVPGAGVLTEIWMSELPGTGVADVPVMCT